MEYLEISGDYLEGGGQILRTAAAFSCISARAIRVTNIRLKRDKPGLKPQHLAVLKTLEKLFTAKVSGLTAESKEITFAPAQKEISKQTLEVDIGTSGAIGLFLQPLLLAASFKSTGLSLNIKGGTTGLGAVPVEYYSNCIIPLLSRFGLNADLKIRRRGYFPKGGGEVIVNIHPLKNPKPIDLTEQGNLKMISGKSQASMDLMARGVAQRQAKEAEGVLRKDFSCEIKIDSEYLNTLSTGSEINLYAHFDSFTIMGADVRGEPGKLAEKVGREAAEKLKKEIESGAGCDVHLADNLIPWLALLGGSIRVSSVSLHTLTNIWVAEQFFGKIFNVEENLITSNGQGYSQNP